MSASAPTAAVPAECAAPRAADTALGHLQAARRRGLVGLYLLLVALYLPFTAGHFSSQDHVAVYRTTESLVERGSLAVEPVLGGVVGPDGQWYSKYGLGQAVLAIPLYLVGRAVDVHASPPLRAFFSGIPLDGWGGNPRIFFVSLFNVLVMPLVAVVVFLFVGALGCRAGVALATALTFALGTAAFVYARDAFQHPLEALCLLLAVYLLFRHRTQLRARDALLSGAALALGVATRLNLLLAAPLLAAYLAALTMDRRPLRAVLAAALHARPTGARRRLPAPSWPALRALLAATRPSWRLIVAFALPLATVMLVVLWLNAVRFGHVLATGYGGLAGGEFDPGFGSSSILVGLYGYAFSLGRSVFLYSPPLIAGVLAFPRLWRAQPREAALVVALTTVYLLLYATWRGWEGGWAWGPRFLVPLIPFWILPCAYWLQRRATAVLVAALAVLGVGVQVLGATVNYSFMIHEGLRAGPQPSTVPLFVPQWSPLPAHLQALLANHNVDVWLLWVNGTFGPLAALAALAVPLLLLVEALLLLPGLRAFDALTR